MRLLTCAKVNRKTYNMRDELHVDWRWEPAKKGVKMRVMQHPCSDEHYYTRDGGCVVYILNEIPIVGGE